MLQSLYLHTIIPNKFKANTAVHKVPAAIANTANRPPIQVKNVNLFKLMTNPIICVNRFTSSPPFVKFGGIFRT